MSFTRLAASSVRANAVRAPRLSRTYAQEGVAGKEPINLERAPSKTPFFIAAALAVLGGGYFLGWGSTPATPAVKNVQHSMHAKTPQSKQAEGTAENIQDEPHKAGGDMKGRPGAGAPDRK
ncbi:hypothetical protein JCM10213_008920 [Rhodosporidiobolus nylandii]